MRAKSARSFGGIHVHTPRVAAGQRVGIMGGSFNPPHEGHRIVAETALKRLRLDQVWWLVTPGNPLKSHNGLPSEFERMDAIARLAKNPRMKITSFERALRTPFTAATLSFLETRHRDVHFVWVMGADNLASFHRWQNWRRIAETMPIAVVDRPGWRLKALSSPAAHAMTLSRVPECDAGRLAMMAPPAWTFLTSRLSSLSSTQLRTSRLQQQRV